MNDPHTTVPHESLRQSLAQFRCLADSLPICLLQKDAEGRPSFANQAYLKFHEQTLEQVLDFYGRNGDFPEGGNLGPGIGQI